jgi:hypothetical protein
VESGTAEDRFASVRRTFPVREFSTGCSAKSDAEAVGGADCRKARTAPG